MSKQYIKLINETYNNIPGITVIDSWKPGKNIGLFAITHGNEPVWLYIFDQLINNYNIFKNISKGKLYLICVSLETYKQYILQSDPLAYRFIDYNMNRIYKKENISGYESQRFNELKVIFDELDSALDIHSVAKGNDIIGITDKKYYKEMKKIFNTETILVDPNMENSWAMIWYMINKGKMVFGLECGNHIDKTAHKVWLENTLRFLIHTEILDNNKQIYNIPKKWKSISYLFLEEIIPQSLNFSYTKTYKNFDQVKENEVYAKDGDIEYKNNYKETIHIWLVGKKVKIGDGNGFLFKKIIEPI